MTKAENLSRKMNELRHTRLYFYSRNDEIKKTHYKKENPTKLNYERESERKEQK